MSAFRELIDLFDRWAEPDASTRPSVAIGCVFAALLILGVFLTLAVLLVDKAAAHDANDGRTICLFAAPRSF